MIPFKKSKKSLALAPIEELGFQDEQEIEDLVKYKNNMEVLFNLECLKSQFHVSENGRDLYLDSIAFDPKSKCFVIMEYKNAPDKGLVDQGLDYLNMMKQNRGDFVLAYNDKKSKEDQLRLKDLNWNYSRVIFISSVPFSDRQKNSMKGHSNFELWEIRKFEDGLIVIEPICGSKNKQSVRAVKKTPKSPIVSRNSLISEEYHVQKLDSPLEYLWKMLKKKLEKFDDTDFRSEKNYISWVYVKRVERVICYIRFQKRQIRIIVIKGNREPSGKKSRGYYEHNDPKNFARNNSIKFKSGKLRDEYWIDLTKKEDLNYVVHLLEQKYNSLKTKSS